MEWLILGKILPAGRLVSADVTNSQMGRNLYKNARLGPIGLVHRLRRSGSSDTQTS